MRVIRATVATDRAVAGKYAFCKLHGDRWSVLTSVLTADLLTYHELDPTPPPSLLAFLGASKLMGRFIQTGRIFGVFEDNECALAFIQLVFI